MANASATLEQLVADSGWLHRLAVALVKDEATADDLVQDTYSIAATQAPTDGRPLRPWLARVLWNRVRMASRGARRRRAREQAFGELAAPPARPDEIVDRIQLQRTLAGLVLDLAAPQRDVLLLHYFEGLTSSQIGQRLGISAGTVRWRLKQAIDELRDRLEQRSPNRAWVASLATFARTAPKAKLALLPPLLFAAFALLAIVAFVLRVQLGEAQRVVPSRTATHEPARPPALPMLGETSGPGHASAALGLGPVFAAEQRSLRGLVVDGSGQGVAGADVELDCGYGDGVKLKQRTGVGGTFAFEIDPHCHYVVSATKGDARGQQTSAGPMALGIRPGATSELAAFGLFDRERFRAVIQLRRMALAVIHVIDAETGGPIANARISSAWFSDDDVSAVTGSDGIARLNVQLPSRITVDADHYAYAREVLGDPRPHMDRSAIFIGGGPEAEVPAQVSLDVRLNRAIAVSGTVVGPDGNPVASASVLVGGPLGAPRIFVANATTDERGRFETKVSVAGKYALSADRSDLTNDGEVGVDIPVEGRTNLIAHVVPRGEIRGTVVDLSNKPVAGARVSLADGTIPPVVADAQGRFVIANVACAVDPDAQGRVVSANVVRAVDLIANHGSEASAFHHIPLTAGERAEVVLQVGPTGISGIAVEHDGTPVEGAEVWLNFCCEGSPNLVEGKRITTDASGRFSFDTPRGDFVLSVKRDEDDVYEDEDDVKVAGGSHDVRLVVP